MTTTPPISLSQKIKALCAKHPVISLILLWVLVWKAFWWHYNTPIKNPWPEHPYTIKGRFPFDKGVDIVFALNVTGAAKWHRWICGGINVTYAGCSAAPEYFWPQKVDGQHYQMTMYKDYYLKGLPQWSESNFSDKPYKPQVGFDPTKGAIGGNTGWKNIPIICDDSEESIRERKGGLRCHRQYEDAERKVGDFRYKHLKLPASQVAGPNEQVMDFWLYSELEEMLKEPGNAPPPTPTSTTPTKQ